MERNVRVTSAAAGVVPNVRYYAYGIAVDSELALALPDRGGASLATVGLRCVPESAFVESRIRAACMDAFHKFAFLPTALHISAGIRWESSWSRVTGVGSTADAPTMQPGSHSRSTCLDRRSRMPWSGKGFASRDDRGRRWSGRRVSRRQWVWQIKSGGVFPRSRASTVDRRPAGPRAVRKSSTRARGSTPHQSISGSGAPVPPFRRVAHEDECRDRETDPAARRAPTTGAAGAVGRDLCGHRATRRLPAG